MNKLLKKLIVAGIITTSVYAPTSVRATEAPVKYDLISTADAVKGAIPVTLYFGKITLLDFTEAGEYITFIAPSDRSQFVYNTDLPVNSSEAQSVYLLPIKKVDFKGTYQTSHPNLIVKTINSSGQSKQYNFIINFSSGVMTSTGIKIIPSTQKSLNDSNKIRVSAGQTINASDIERGLRIAIVKQFIEADDPVVNKVRNFVFMLRNGNSVNDAITHTGINPSVVESLGEMYLRDENLLLDLKKIRLLLNHNNNRQNSFFINLAENKLKLSYFSRSITSNYAWISWTGNETCI